MNNIDEYLDSMDSKIRTYGWAWVYVVDHDCGAEPGEPCAVTQEDADGLGFGYTVGLTRHYGHPEIAITGVPMRAADLLNRLGERIRDGAVLHPGDRVALGNSLTAMIIAVSWEKSYENMPVAWKLNGGPVAALQVVLPDANNRMPWEAGYALDPHDQPLWGDAP